MRMEIGGDLCLILQVVAPYCRQIWAGADSVNWTAALVHVKAAAGIRHPGMSLDALIRMEEKTKDTHFGKLPMVPTCSAPEGRTRLGKCSAVSLFLVY